MGSTVVDRDWYGIFSGHQLNRWFRTYYNKYKDEPMSKCPHYITPVKKFVAQHLVAIKIYNGFEDDDREPTVGEANRYWGHLVGKLNVELERGIFDKSLMPIAATDYVVNGTVVVEAEHQYDNWGQVTHHTSTGAIGWNLTATTVQFSERGQKTMATRKANGTDIETITRSKTEYAVKPKGCEGERYKSTTGCEGSVNQLCKKSVMTTCSCGIRHSKISWRLESELKNAEWIQCMKCKEKDETTMRIMPNGKFVLRSTQTSCRKSSGHNGKHGGCGHHSKWRRVNRPSSDHQTC
mmetsp:Transcript_12413/g.26952  ORF Transcript_12413/g.26952 Transcript_12413/m.26952 type:complete len:294 (+) Transcript_12413:290-1171(+)